MAYIELRSTTTSSLTVRLNGLGNYSYDDRATHWYLNGTDKATVSGPSANATYGAQYTFSGLSPSTTYTIKAVVYYYAGTSTLMSTTITTNSSGNTAQFTTSALPSPSVTLTTTVLSHNAIRARFTYDSNYPYYRLRWKSSSSSTWIYSGSSYTSYSSTTNYSIGSLSTNTPYDIEVLVATSSSGANSSSGDTDSARTLPALSADIQITSIGKNSVSGKVTIDSNYRYIQAIYREASTNTPLYSPSSISNGYQSGSTWTFTINNLVEDTDYVLNGRCSATGEISYAYNIKSEGLPFHTLSSVSVASWDWDAANATANPNPATQAQTQAARNACRGKTAVSNFSWKVWNDLVYKVSEVRVAGGKSEWNNYYGLTRDQTLMTSSNKTLTAVRYNSLRYNIGSVFEVPDSKKIAEVSRGDNVEGTKHFLNFVTNYLNAYIDDINTP
jgi:hypothetical protein